MANSADRIGPDGLTDAERDAKWRSVDAAIGRSKLSVVPLYAPQGARVPKHGGCGVVVRAGSHVAILTAGHVFDGFQHEEGSRILVATNGAFVPITGTVSRSRIDTPDGDTADAAVIVLESDESSRSLAELALPWSLAAVPGPQEPGTALMLYGYPHRDAERTDGLRVLPRRYFWEAQVASREAFAALGVKPNESILADIPVSQSVASDGAVVRSVTPAGVSGSGVWLLGTAPPRLYGIFTGMRDDRMFATPVIVHALMLRRAFPAVYAALAA